MDREVRYCSLNNKRFCTSITIIGQSSEGWSKPNIVKFEYEGKELKGYYKIKDVLGEKNSVEVILNKVGKVLNVPMADIVCIFSDNTYKDITDIISVSVAQFPYEYFISFREMRDELFWDLQKGIISANKWIKRWKIIRERKNTIMDDIWDVAAINDSDYYDSIQFAFEISKLYVDKHGIEINDFQSMYVKMLMFDILIGQADRTPSNYGLLINNDLSRAALAPLFDNSTLTKPYIKRDEIALNQVVLKKEKLAQIIYEIYPNDFQEIKEKFLEKGDELQWIIKREKYLSKENKKFISNLVREGLEIFGTIR